jgi:hypothetical protein
MWISILVFDIGTRDIKRNLCKGTNKSRYQALTSAMTISTSPSKFKLILPSDATSTPLFAKSSSRRAFAEADIVSQRL